MAVPMVRQATRIAIGYVPRANLNSLRATTNESSEGCLFGFWKEPGQEPNLAMSYSDTFCTAPPVHLAWIPRRIVWAQAQTRLWSTTGGRWRLQVASLSGEPAVGRSPC